MTYLSEKQNMDFIGTGENNEAGQDLSTFLNNYNPDKYKNPCNTVDTLVFTYNDNNGKITINKILLIKRKNHPSIGWWALPGGFVEYREDLRAAALRELKEETGIDNIQTEQLKSYGEYDRDPRARIITTAYVALVPEGSLKAMAGDDAKEAEWFNIVDEHTSDNIHSLRLYNDDKSINIGAEIEVTYDKSAILKNYEYKVISRNGIAADHGAIILEGYHYISQKFIP